MPPLHAPAPSDPSTLEKSSGVLKGTIFDIMRYCVHDGPGIRTVVFMKGCPLSCPWCHNPEGMEKHVELSFREDRCLRCGDCYEICPNGAIEKRGEEFFPVREKCLQCGECVARCVAEARELVGREVTVGDVMGEILRDRPFYDHSGGGVTFSGGEPLFQHEFLEALLKACRAEGIHTVVETTGFTGWSTLERIAASTDLFLYDLKSMDENAHRHATGVGNRRILENLELLSQGGHAVIARIPVIPGVNDDAANLAATATFLISRTQVREVHLLPFHRIGRDKSLRLGKDSAMPDAPILVDPALASLVAIFEAHGLRTIVGG
jgi:pyruvate formate lyase activating enzyme